MHYVVGFLFRRPPGLGPFDEVALIEKKRPCYLAGKLNGIGGGVERGETPEQAMVREMREESGVETSPYDWKLFATLNTERHDRIDFLYSTCDHAVKLQTLTDEPVGWLALSDIQDSPKLNPNLHFFIPMALLHIKGWNVAKHLHLIET